MAKTNILLMGFKNILLMGFKNSSAIISKCGP
jgi:hypothetical protein